MLFETVAVVRFDNERDKKNVRSIFHSLILPRLVLSCWNKVLVRFEFNERQYHFTISKLTTHKICIFFGQNTNLPKPSLSNYFEKHRK